MFKERVLIAEELNSKHRTIILRMGEHVPLECTEGALEVDGHRGNIFKSL